MEIFSSQSAEDVRMPLELLLGRNLLILLSIFPAETINIHEELYMHSLNVGLKNLHRRLLCKELLVGIIKC